MRSPFQVEALMRGGRIYTLHPYHGDPLRSRNDLKGPWKYVGFCDGQHWGLFRSKKQFRERVEMEPEHTEWEMRGPHADATNRAVQDSEWDGTYLLHKFLESVRRRKGENG
jgi:hypothetical protein